MNVDLLKNQGIDVEKSLELFGDMETYTKLLEEFLGQVDDKLKEAENYKSVRDLVNYEVVVHSLKSDFRYFGADKVGDMFYSHELAAKEGNFSFIESDFNNLVTKAKEIVTVFKKALGQSTSNEIKTNDAVTETDNNILVVDDSNIIRNFILNVFSDSYNVILANDGREAINTIEILSSDKIVCMLLDLNMPKVNGFEVLEYFKRKDLFDKIPVSIITGIDSQDLIQEAFKYPIVDIIQKPFSQEKVKNILLKTIREKKS